MLGPLVFLGLCAVGILVAGASYLKKRRGQ